MVKIVFQFSIKVYHNDQQTSVKSYAPKSSPEGPTFLEKASKTIEQLAGSRGVSTICNYQTALRSFVAFSGANLKVGEVNQQLMEGWQQWLKEKSVTLNTISCYMRSLRAIVAHIEDDMLTQKTFKNVFTGNTRTDKRSIPPKDLRKVCELQLPENSFLEFTRDLFIFCVFALGMPLVDVAFLRKKQMNGGYIEYYRHKTRQRVRIKIEKPMLQIINRYTQRDSPFVFPILKEGTMQEYHTFRGRYNRCLKKLSAMASLSRQLTSYVARHSWASMAYHSNVDLPVISKALGHTSSKTTLVYIREIDDNRIDKANHKLLGDLIKKE